MADVDFNINIRTIADTTGIKLTQQGLDALKVAALQGNQQAITSLQQLTNAQKGAAVAGAGNAAELGRLVGTFTGFGIAGGLLAFINSLKKGSDEIAKISAELDKQGEQLVKHAQLYDQQARHAKDGEDVLKVSSETLKDIESTQKTVNDLAQRELNAAQKFSDYLQVQLLARQKIAGVGDYEAARRTNLDTAQSQATEARQRGMQEVLAAEKALNQTAAEHISILNREIAAEEKRKAAAATNTDPGGYVKAANNLAVLNKELVYFTNLQEKAASAARSALEKAVPGLRPQPIKEADLSVQRILMNEQAAATAEKEGRSKDVDLYRSSAQALKRGLTTDQQQQLKDVQRMMSDSIGGGGAAGASNDAVIQAIMQQTAWMKSVWGY